MPGTMSDRVRQPCDINPSIVKGWTRISVNKVAKGDYVRGLERGVPDSIVERKDAVDGRLYLIGCFQLDDKV